MKTFLGTLYFYCLLIIKNNVVPIYGDNLFPLTITHINDFHARFEETNVRGRPCKPNETCIGGLARVVYTIKKIFEEQEKKDIDSLYINAGDNFQGTIWYNLGRWNVTTQLMNIKPPDAMVLGNHEFDHGIDGVLPFINNMNQTEIVVANMNATDEPRMQNKIKPFTIIKKKNRSIGIIGVILEGVPNLTSTGKLTFRNESEAIMKAARELKEKDPEINIIIVVSHVGFEVDKIIAEHTGSEVDIIVGGHSHTFLYTGIPPGPKEPEDNYPYVYKHSSGNKVLIVQAACHAKYVGNLTVFFDKAGKVAKYEGAPIYMDSEVSKDEDVVKAMEPWKKLFDEKSKLVVGKTKVDLLREPCRLGECRLGNFFTDAVIEAFGDKNNCTSDKGNWTTTPIALVNAGALRISLDKGDLHYADVVTMSPFTNMIIAYDIPGAQLKKALEFSVATQNIDERRRFLQVSGLKVTYNSSREMNNRVVDLKIRTNACPYPQYEKFDEKKIYRIASPSFLQGGGDGFHMLPEKATNLHNQLIDLDALLNYLKKHKEIEPKLENRIKIVH